MNSFRHCKHKKHAQAPAEPIIKLYNLPYSINKPLFQWLSSAGKKCAFANTGNCTRL